MTPRASVVFVGLVVLAKFAAAVRPRLAGLHHLLAPVELVIAHRIILRGGRAQFGPNQHFVMAQF